MLNYIRSIYTHTVIVIPVIYESRVSQIHGQASREKLNVLLGKINCFLPCPEK